MLAKPYVYDVLKIIENKSDKFIYLILFIAMTLTTTVNYLIGRIIIHYVKSIESKDNYQKGYKYFNKYLYPISLFTFFSIWGGIIAVIAGFFRLNYKRFLILVLLGNFIKIMMDLYF